MASPETISRQTLRLIDANLNRIGEGLRFLEDLARLLLNDATLTQQLKTIRHELVTSDWSFNQQLLQSRDSEGDVGVNIEVPQQEKQRELPIMAVANARRVQEALRVVEKLVLPTAFSVRAQKTAGSIAPRKIPEITWGSRRLISESLIPAAWV